MVGQLKPMFHEDLGLKYNPKGSRVSLRQILTPFFFLSLHYNLTNSNTVGQITKNLHLVFVYTVV